jgi:excisionase family DNA binding protein
MDEDQWPEFVTVAEVPGMLRVSNMTVYRLLADGQLDATRVGRSIRIHAGSLRQYLKAGGG